MSEIKVTEDKSIWRSEREQSVIDLLFEAIKDDDAERIARFLDGTNRTMKSLMTRKVLLVSRPPK